MRLATIPVLIALRLLPGPSAALAEEGANCFCLIHPAEAYFLWGCRDVSPRDATSMTAQCWDLELQDFSEAEVVVERGWRRVEPGQGSCRPCRPQASSQPEAFRGESDPEP